MFSILSAKRRRHLIKLAEIARQNGLNRILAVILVVFYNIVGFTDILSTEYAIKSGAAVEANPLMRSAMESFSWAEGWVLLKLALQFTVTAMVLWFPNRTVMGLFATVATLNALIVINNLSIANIL